MERLGVATPPRKISRRDSTAAMRSSGVLVPAVSPPCLPIQTNSDRDRPPSGHDEPSRSGDDRSRPVRACCCQAPPNTTTTSERRASDSAADWRLLGGEQTVSRKATSLPGNLRRFCEPPPIAGLVPRVAWSADHPKSIPEDDEIQVGFPGIRPLRDDPPVSLAPPRSRCPLPPDDTLDAPTPPVPGGRNEPGDRWHPASVFRWRGSLLRRRAVGGDHHRVRGHRRDRFRDADPGSEPRQYVLIVDQLPGDRRRTAGGFGFGQGQGILHPKAHSQVFCAKNVHAQYALNDKVDRFQPAAAAPGLPGIRISSTGRQSPQAVQCVAGTPCVRPESTSRWSGDGCPGIPW